ncbi:hypothetical protein GQ53DRAFT_697068 [Thozetella sp. PMI_491]|nr:hypothetical protein GQ53DRAFT_697068 [Thozetella sp. PMI_491]
MQRVSSLLPSWDRSRSNSNAARPTVARQTPRALDKVFGWAAAPINRINTAAPAAPTSYGREAYWPTSLDKECEKAARILKSFCTDGFLAQEDDSRPTSPTAAPPSPKYANKKIPPRIIQNAVGIAIFSCMRSGLWMSGSGGSGILIARKADGTWSPPSGIILHTAELGFVIGVDIYDCVLVINNVAVLEMFTRPRVTLGTDVNLTVGPLVTSGLLENELQIRWKELDGTVLTYLKARGKHQSVQLDGSLVTERTNENERFYAGDVNVLDILAGNIPKELPEIRPLFEVIKAAEGRTDYDTALMEMLAQQPAPGDATIETPKVSPLVPPKSPFGIPNQDDPDPFGVIALEMAGLEIREAGTRLRPTSSQFEYNPAPTSPLYSKFNRQSVDTYLSRSNRGSYVSTKTQATTMTDVGTQTDCNAESSVGKPSSEARRPSSSAPVVREPEEIDYTKIDVSAIEQFSRPQSQEPEHAAVGTIPEEDPQTTDHGVGTDDAVVFTSEEPSASPAIPGDAAVGEGADEGADDADDEEEEEEDEPIIFEVTTATQPPRAAIMSSQVTQVIQAKGALVTIPKRIPPPLPLRSPARVSRASKEYGDVSALKSPLRTSFQSEDFAAAEEPQSTSAQVAPLADAAEAPSTTEPDTVHGHHKNSSSVYTAIPRRSSLDMASPPSQPVELTSSAEDSDREPQTPKPTESFQTRGVEHMKDASIHNHGNDSSVITVV